MGGMPALEGIRVLDLTRLLPGPYAARLLAEMGAEVVKIEDPSGGDPARWYPPYMGDPPASGIYHALNEGKRSVALDLRSEDGRVALEQLAGEADVLLDTFRPGVLAHLGLAPERLRRRNPGLVYAAVTGFGLDGPDARRPGHDIGYMARAGMLGLTPGADGPSVLGLQVADIGGALAAVAGICAALVRRARTGEGGVVDISLTEAALAFGTAALGQRRAGAELEPGKELLDGSRACYGVYRTADDRFLAIGALEPKFWLRVVEALELTEHAAFGLDDGPDGARAKAAVAARVASASLAHWEAVFDGLEACVEPLRSLDELMTDRQMVARGAVGSDGRVAGPIRVNGCERGPLGEAPGLGEHTREVLQAHGLEPERIERICSKISS